jgi:Zn-finger nucleic acid-binding protein
MNMTVKLKDISITAASVRTDDAEIRERVRSSKIQAQFAGDPLNLAKRTMKDADEEARHMAKIRKAIKAKERFSGEGVLISGNGLTEGKFREPKISRLINNGRIGGVEMQAVSEIEMVYTHLCAGLFLKGYELKERGDKSSSANDPPWFIDAYHKRYKPWADDWSSRKKQFSDKTLEVVFDFLFTSMSGRDLDVRESWKHGTAIKLFINGVRDYSASAGWAERNTAQRWHEMARSVFPVRRMRREAA